MIDSYIITKSKDNHNDDENNAQNKDKTKKKLFKKKNKKTQKTNTITTNITLITDKALTREERKKNLFITSKL